MGNRLYIKIEIVWQILMRLQKTAVLKHCHIQCLYWTYLRVVAFQQETQSPLISFGKSWQSITSAKTKSTFSKKPSREKKIYRNASICSHLRILLIKVDFPDPELPTIAVFTLTSPAEFSSFSWIWMCIIVMLLWYPWFHFGQFRSHDEPS